MNISQTTREPKHSGRGWTYPAVNRISCFVSLLAIQMDLPLQIIAQNESHPSVAGAHLQDTWQVITKQPSEIIQSFGSTDLMCL